MSRRAFLCSRARAHTPHERPAARFTRALRRPLCVEREIGRGATATVYLAHDAVEAARRDKRCLPRVVQLRGGSFLREIYLTSTLTHPRILPVLDAGESAGQRYFVLPFMEGGTLRQRLARERQLSIADAIAIARTIAEALDQAHRQGLVHRDIKPENVLFQDGEAYLADLGIARVLERSLGDTSTSLASLGARSST